MIKYEIEGGSLPVVICYPEAGQTLCTESGAMSWMSPNMKMDTNTGGGLKKVLGRMFSGESIFMNEYTAQGGEGFIMQQIKGDGTVFLEIDGYCKQYDLAAGESIIADTGYLAAMSETCTMDIETVKGAKNIFFGGEGLFNTRITGPGRVYIQSMPVINTARALSPYLNVSNGDSNSGGINIKLGD